MDKKTLQQLGDSHRNIQKEYADSIYLNGRIITLDEDIPDATSIAIRGGRIIHVGSNKTVRAYKGENTVCYDLKETVVLPGLVEGHIHLSMYGQNLLKINGVGLSKEALLRLVESAAKNAPKGQWIVGFGWNQEQWMDSTFPTKEELDQMAPNHPVVLERVDAHTLWVNSMALALAGIQDDTENPDGGEILKNVDGGLTGILIDAAGTWVTSKLPELEEEKIVEGILKAQEELFKYGITSVGDAGVSQKETEVFRGLYQSGRLKLRVYQMLGDNWNRYSEDVMQSVCCLGPDVGLYEDRYTLRAVKLFVDGSLGSRSASLIDAYSDRPGHYGSYKYSKEELVCLIKIAQRYGWQLVSHGIGDGANRMIVEAYESVLLETPQENHRWRIEHFQIVDDETIEKAGTLKILPSIQPQHLISDLDMTIKRLGKDRMSRAYPWQKIIKFCNRVMGGSDAPVEVPNPFYGIYSAIVDKSIFVENEEFYQQSRLCRMEAIKAYTCWGAYGQFEEALKGSLSVGKLGDFILVDRDVIQCSDEELKATKVLGTVIHGEWVYGEPLQAVL